MTKPPDCPKCNIPMIWDMTFELESRFLECFKCPSCGTPGGVGTDKPTLTEIRQPTDKIKIVKVRGNLVKIIHIENRDSQ